MQYKWTQSFMKLEMQQVSYVWCMYTLASCVTLYYIYILLYPNHSAAAGFDYKGGSYVATFMANMMSAVVNIPIVADLNSTEGTECFLVHLSVHPIMSNLEEIAVSLGRIREATVCIRDEIIISFQDENIVVKEGENLTLTVIANAASDQDFTITVNITGTHSHKSCKLIS